MFVRPSYRPCEHVFGFRTGQTLTYREVFSSGVNDRLVDPENRRAVLVGAGLQFAVLVVALRIPNVPAAVAYVGSPLCGVLAGAATEGLWPESAANGGIATAGGGLAYFVASVLYAIVMTLIEKGVFAPQIVVSLVSLVAAFTVPILMIVGFVGGYVGYWVRRVMR